MSSSCSMKTLKVLELFMILGTLCGCSVRNTIVVAEQKLGDTTQEVTRDVLDGTVQAMTGDLSIGQDVAVATVDAPCGSILGYAFTEKAVKIDDLMAILTDSSLCNGVPPRMMEDADALDPRQRYYFTLKDGSTDLKIYTNNTYSAIYGYSFYDSDGKDFEALDICLGNRNLKGCSLREVREYYGEESARDALVFTNDWYVVQYGWCTQHSAEPNLWLRIKFWNEGGMKIQAVEYMVPTEWVDKMEEDIEEESVITGNSEGVFE